MNAYDLSAAVFVRGLTNLKAQLAKAQAQLAASGSDETTLLRSRLAREVPSAAAAPGARFDLHAYTLAAHVHWAAEGARLAIGRLLGDAAVPDASVESSFAELRDRLDATIAQLRAVAPADLEAGLARTIVHQHRGGSVTATGDRFLLAYAIPHFLYHVTTAYGILRNEGVPLTMGDFLGDWATN